ncbi:hypothetical protein [Cyclobacterium sp. SYSU L10401]|uniref:hypothetical protein n=1 Tax=Cyclobacterium sp. SYSU L10401 TaxID=2678657 RepID=UPI0013D1B780|nr:hypothetical protein [Cyclobacterium sp. SYSU L10401]
MNLIPFSSMLHLFLKVNRFFRLKLIFVLVFSFAISFKVTAQTEAEKFTARNLVYLEIGGNAGQYAFNYGSLIYQKRAFKVIGSVGFSLWVEPIEGPTIWNPAIPLEVSTLFGAKKHHLEFGVGITPFLQAGVNSSWESGNLVQSKGASHLGAILPIRVGYRYQKPEGGFFFRLGYTPFFAMPNKTREYWAFQPVFAGLGLGVSF